ncbi:WcbI family polysaccharide biosynthesis putative acetyltransferase [Rhizobium rhizogenes]|uniref:WcbI family polysaccharide biosynthesis putative acetyltransferase n=1 Tax=Rhizobium rhizogenes TaxID=359 RepID=UPI003ED137F7
MERWLLISNCNTYGLARSLQLLSNSFELDCVDVWQFKKNMQDYTEKIPKYDRVIINPIAELMGYDFSSVENLYKIPNLEFDAYHPDFCFSTARGERIYKPLAANQSMIILSAFKAGLSIEKTRKLFRRDIYEQCGFFSRWEPARDRLISSFAAFGMDITNPFRRWSRGESFMHSLAHPKARPILDVARTFLRNHGIETNKMDLVPFDTIVDGACLPVYPEIGEIFGVGGSYMFKLPGEYRLISLEKFIELSFEAYSSFEVDEITVEPGFLTRFNRVKQVIAETDA